MVTKGYGITVDDIDWSCPADLEPYAKAHAKEIEEKDNLMYAWFGNYALSAVLVAVEQNIHGRKAKSKYLGKTVLQKIEDENYRKKEDRKEYKGMTAEEKQAAEWEKAKNYFDELAARFSKKQS